MPKHILVPLDGSATAEQALPHAAELARLFGAELTLVRVPEPMLVPTLSAGVWVAEQVDSPKAHEVAAAYVTEVAARPAFGGLTVHTATPHYPVAGGLLEACTTTGSDLIVMTAHGFSGVRRLILGSVADKLLHHAPSPVYVVHPTEDRPRPPAFRQVVVPLDGSPLAEAALPVAVDLCHASGGHLTLVQVPTLPAFATAIPDTAGWIPGLMAEMTAEAREYLEQHVNLLSTGPVPVSAQVEVVAAGSVADGITHFVHEHDADVVVMSSHGRGGVARWFLGSVADQVLRQSERPVWVIRANANHD